MATEHRPDAEPFVLPHEPMDPDEIARRAHVVRKLRAIRKAIGPTGLTVEELLADDDESDQPPAAIEVRVPPR